MVAKDTAGFRKELARLLHERKLLLLFEIRDVGSKHGLDKSEVAAQLATLARKGLVARSKLDAYVSSELAEAEEDLPAVISEEMKRRFGLPTYQ